MKKYSRLVAKAFKSRSESRLHKSWICGADFKIILEANMLSIVAEAFKSRSESRLHKSWIRGADF